jgi:hypothetical protein
MLHCVNAKRAGGIMKKWRRTAIRYDRLGGNFRSAIERIASGCFCL